jgi:hypothetical protein
MLITCCMLGQLDNWMFVCFDACFDAFAHFCTLLAPCFDAPAASSKKIDTYFKNAAASLPPVAHGFESTCAVGAMHRG